MNRLSSVLANTPRALRHSIMDKTPKHQYFGGGANASRFQRQAWLRQKSAPQSRHSRRSASSKADVCFDDLRPGSRRKRTGPTASAFSSLTPSEAGVAA